MRSLSARGSIFATPAGVDISPLFDLFSSKTIWLASRTTASIVLSNIIPVSVGGPVTVSYSSLPFLLRGLRKYLISMMSLSLMNCAYLDLMSCGVHGVSIIAVAVLTFVFSQVSASRTLSVSPLNVAGVYSPEST